MPGSPQSDLRVQQRRAAVEAKRAELEEAEIALAEAEAEADEEVVELEPEEIVAKMVDGHLLTTAEMETVESLPEMELEVPEPEPEVPVINRWQPPCDDASRALALGEPEDSPLMKCWMFVEPLPQPDFIEPEREGGAQKRNALEAGTRVHDHGAEYRRNHTVEI